MKPALILFVLLAMSAMSYGKVSKQPAGTVDGQAIDVYTLQDGKITVRILSYGGRKRSSGRSGSVCLRVACVTAVK